MNPIDEMLQAQRPFMVLQLLVEDKNLLDIYKKSVVNHNNKILQTIKFPDAGFDLFVPFCHVVNTGVGSHRFVCSKVNKLDMGVKCSALLYDRNGNSVNTGYYLYPRSSISKSCIRLANSVGIIDAGYRGPMIAMVDVVYGDECFLNAYDKMFQICAPGLVPIIVELIDMFEEKTERGEGGFGSTNHI